MGITQGTPISQRCRPLEESVEESFEFGRTRPVRLEHATTNAKTQLACQLHRSVDELGLPRPSAALDHDGSAGPSTYLSEPVFDDDQLLLATPKRPGLLGHVASRTRPDSVLATSSKGSQLRRARERTTAPSVAAIVTVANRCAAPSDSPPATKSSASWSVQVRKMMPTWSRMSP